MSSNTPPQTRATAHREFQRAYKACIPCRQRKSKCQPSEGDDSTASLPCTRCRRERRQCVFSTDQPWARRKKSGSKNNRESVQSQFDRAPNGAGSDGQSIQSGSQVFSPPRSNNDTRRDPTHSSRLERSGNHTLSPEAHQGHSGSSHRGRRVSTPNELTNSVVRTVVSSGNDALNLLFQAAAHEGENTSSIDQSASNPGQGAPPAQGTSSYVAFSSSASLIGSQPGPSPAKISPASRDVLRVWEACRFVRMGWFSAREAITYIDTFFRNMASLSPILTDFYSRHENHYWLVTQEPVLCCTILMISSRYHILPGVGGVSRAFSIHHRLWQHCQHLITRLIFGQEKGSKAKTRTICTIEALLLMSEWHPRAIHFPPESDGWDSDLILTAADDQDISTTETTATPSSQWIEDVIEPARRSDRMSWMLLGCALTLAHELAVFEVDRDEFSSNSSSSVDDISYKRVRKQRIRRLLYVYINQHASRLGCMSLMPQSLNHSIVAGMQTCEGPEDEWQSFTRSWVELTRLTTSVSDMLFPSTSFTRKQLHDGRYISLLDHFRPLLKRWKENHFENKNFKVEFCDILFVEYQYVRVYINSLGMQAVVERALAENSDISHDEIGSINLNEIDYEFIQEVVDGSCQILRRITKIAELGALKFSPVRVFLRITSCSIFLLKALSLGVRNAKLHECLDTLERSIQALRSSALDDIHLASRYASLLDVHVSRLRRSFIASSKHSRPCDGALNRPSPAGAPPRTQTNDKSISPTTGSLNAEHEALPPDFYGVLPDDDWLSLPFDPSMAPFGTGSGTPAFPDFDESALDFVWNLPP